MNEPLQQEDFAVKDTEEFRRVLHLPRRDWSQTATHNDLHLRISQAFRMPRGTQVLRSIQAAALADAHDLRGLLAPIPVGGGKTLVSYLLPTVLQNIHRPVLLLDAALVEKTWREFKKLREHWVFHPAFANRKAFNEAVISYQLLSRESGRYKLHKRNPDLIVADEVHMLRNREASCTRKFERFMISHPETVFCGMSGTITNRSIHDYWHLLYFALRHNMPLPRSESEMSQWAEVLDERKVDVFSRRQPGALLQFCTPEERAAAQPQRTAPVGRTQQMPMLHFHEQLKAARQGYQRRFRQTPGIVCAHNTKLACSLIVRRCSVYPGDTAMDMLNTLRTEWVTPNGDAISWPPELWRIARELSCGFWYRWTPPPPPHWLNARKSWAWAVRQVLLPEGIWHAKYQHMHVDSKMQIAQAILEGRIDDPELVEPYERWKEVEGDYVLREGPVPANPQSGIGYKVAEWVDDGVLNFCLDWMRQNKSGIVWTEHRAFGHKLARMLGTGFCSNGGQDEQGRMIEDYEGRPVVASVAANHKGRNLQAWNRNLVVTAKPVGWLWEQIIGRTHREGQIADTVFVDWVAACDEQDQGFSQVLADATYTQDTTGTAQKVLYADRV